jgi:superfamily II DNA/RNA helicase
LKAEGVPALALHGDMRRKRDRSLKRSPTVTSACVATDVAARGLDLTTSRSS